MSFGHQYFSEAYGQQYAARNPARKLRAYVAEIRRFVPGGTLLEVGCAYGLFAREASAHFSVVGVDVDPEVVREAERRAPGCRFVAGSLPALEVPGTFDVVACFDVLEHVPDVAAALLSIRRHLNPTGVLALTVPVYDGPLGPVVDALDKDLTHVHRCSRAFWYHVLAATGFQVVRRVGAFRLALAAGAYVHLTSSLAASFSPAILVVARPVLNPPPAA